MVNEDQKPEQKAESKEQPSAEQKSTVQDLLTDMKNNGFSGAVIRTDGLLLSSTISLNESGASTFASLSNVFDALLKNLKDTQREIEISAGGIFLVLLPVDQYILCGVIKNREEKKNLREYADKLKQML